MNISNNIFTLAMPLMKIFHVMFTQESIFQPYTETNKYIVSSIEFLLSHSYIKLYIGIQCTSNTANLANKCLSCKLLE